MIYVCDKKDCTGCGACASVCPNKCITMEYDKYGFLYPVIDKSRCLNCGICKTKCPSLNQVKTTKPIYTIAACDKNLDRKSLSTSGGLANLFSIFTINNGGVVCGAAYEKDFSIVHKCNETIDSLQMFCGSKYAQSDISSCYEQISNAINSGKQVLFIGTPCQVAGVKAAFKNHDNLLTIDLLCHGTPSCAVLKNFINNVESHYDKPVTELRFRTNGCNTYITSNNVVIYDKQSTKCLYYMGFMRGLFNRLSCYKCKYANDKRCSDLTLGDFWGLKSQLFKGRPTSLCLINTDKGQKLFDSCKNEFIYEIKSIEEAKNHNKSLRRPTKKHISRGLFFRMMSKNNFFINAGFCLIPERLFFWILQKIQN